MIRIILIAVLFAPLSLCRAAAKDADPLIPIDKATDQAEASLTAIERCFSLEAALRADLSSKKTQLAAEYKGKIPPPFEELLQHKTERIAKQHAICIQQHNDLAIQFDQVMLMIRNIEPKNTDHKKQRARAEALRVKYRQMRPGTQSTKPKPSEN